MKKEMLLVGVLLAVTVLFAGCLEASDSSESEDGITQTTQDLGGGGLGGLLGGGGGMGAPPGGDGGGTGGPPGQ
jgi:ABC-type phosphate/phosphonate transport system substrate-binding protein